MKIYKKIHSIQKQIIKLKKQNNIIGFVPTMGALHHGHLSLIKKSKKECDITVVSIFINPMQFGPNEDLNKYPKTIKQDKKNLLNEKTDILFLPEYKEIYNPDFQTIVNNTDKSKILEGAFRIGHFTGVLTVVAKLFNIVLPDRAYFGLKDAQQLFLIKQMVKDMNFPIKIIEGKTVRGYDNIALSSRNTYLSKSQRERAININKQLFLSKKLIQQSSENYKKILKNALKNLEQANLKVQYLKIVEKKTFNIPKIIERRKKYLILCAAYCDKVRLIDNVELRIK